MQEILQESNSVCMSMGVKCHIAVKKEVLQIRLGSSYSEDISQAILEEEDSAHSQSKLMLP